LWLKLNGTIFVLAGLFGCGGVLISKFKTKGFPDKMQKHGDSYE